MTQTERRKYLIMALLKEQPQYSEIEIPSSEKEQNILLRSLFNIRMPRLVTDEFLTIQDTYLQEEVRRKGITSVSDLQPLQQGIYLWQGDITTLRCDGIVNAANSQLLGCFCPNHGCIDNAIHTFAGVQLRLACAELMRKQGHEEETGKALSLIHIFPVSYCAKRTSALLSGKPTAVPRYFCVIPRISLKKCILSPIAIMFHSLFMYLQIV